MNALDIVVLGIVGLSAVLAFARGFVRVATSLAAWGGAGVATVIGFGHVQPIARQSIGSPLVADVVAAVLLFLAVLLVLSLIGSNLADRIRGSSLSALDRSIGFLFGVARGVLVVCLAYLAFAWAVPDSRDWPDWLRAARTQPFLASGADALLALVPGETRSRTAAQAQREFDRARDEAANQAIRAFSIPAPRSGAAAAQAAPKAYNPTERKDMDRLFENAQ